MPNPCLPPCGGFRGWDGCFSFLLVDAITDRIQIRHSNVLFIRQYDASDKVISFEVENDELAIVTRRFPIKKSTSFHLPSNVK